MRKNIDFFKEGDSNLKEYENYIVVQFTLFSCLLEIRNSPQPFRRTTPERLAILAYLNNNS